MGKSKSPPLSADESTAYHEAGHAVADFHLGRAVRSVEMAPADLPAALGVARGYPRPSLARIEYDGPAALNRAVPLLIGLYAGQVAELMVTGRRNVIGARSDDEVINDICQRVTFSDDEVRPLARWADARTAGLLRLVHNWSAVRRIATALIAERRLTATALKALYREAATDDNQRSAAERHLKLIGPHKLL